MLIAEVPGYLRISYEENKDYILYEWLNFQITLEQIQSAFEKALEAAKQKRCYYIIAETSKVTTVLRPEVLEWWGSTWMPKIEKANIRAAATIVPGSALARISSRSWQAEVVSSIAMKNVASLAEAEAFIDEMRQKK